MGRPRAFDPEEVLDIVGAAFWRHGFHGTSMADLCRATGLEKGSLYHAFGDKRAIFVAVLDRYIANALGSFDMIFDPSTPVATSAERWLRGAAAWCTAESCRGCFAVNSIVDLAPHDREFREQLADFTARSRARLALEMERGQREGTVRSDRSPAQLAELLSTLWHGIGAASRGGVLDHEATVTLAMDAIRPSSS